MRINVLDKVGRILDCVAAGEVGVKELAELTGEPRGSLYRLIADLEELGMVEPAAKPGRYRLGIRLYHLGSIVSSRFQDEREASYASMERLHGETDQTVFLAVRRGFEALCIERIDGVLVQEMLLRVGATIPLHVGAVGRLLLAYEPHEFFNEYIENVELTPYTEATPNTPEWLGAELEHIRKAGHAVSDEDVIIGISAIAAPVFGVEGRIRAVLCMSGPRPMILGQNTSSTRTRVTTAAREISAGLGAPQTTNGQGSP